MRPFLLAGLCLFVNGIGPGFAGASFFPASPFSDKAAGTTGAAFLRIPPGAQAQALGGSYVASGGNSEAIFWNPAGLARMQGQNRSEAGFSYNALLETAYGSAVSFAHPLAQERGVWGASVLYFSQAAIQGYTTTGDANGSFTPNDLAVSLAYAKKFSQFSLGGAVKFIRSQLAEVSGTSFAADFGVQAERVTDVGEGALDVGASVRNFGPPIATGSISDPLPFNFTGGMLWHVSRRVNGLLEGSFPVDGDPYATLGVEVNVPISDALKTSIRGGFNSRNVRSIDGLSGVTAGFGVDLNGIRLDYAWVPMGDLGDTHRISMGVRF